MRKLVSPLLIAIALLMPISIAAYDFEQDGIFYNILNSTEIEVTYNNEANEYPDGEYSGSYYLDVKIPATIKHDGVDYTVTAIGDSAFCACSNLNCVTIPYTITSIGNYAFAFNMMSFAIITDADPLCMTMGDEVFYESQYTLYVPSWIYSFYLDDYRWCENCLEIIVSDFTHEGIEYQVIGYYEVEVARCNDTDIEEVIIPDYFEHGERCYTVISIGEEAFANCESLTNITLPQCIFTIGEGAFQNCIALTSVTIPDYVYRLGDRAFENCTSLTSVTLSNDMTAIGYGTFYNCPALTDITIPRSVTSIGIYAFEGCQSLTSIIIPDAVTEIGMYAFLRCDNLASVTIGKSVKSIGDYAFDGCYELKSLTIPRSVTSIGYRAFSTTPDLMSITVESGNPVYDSRDNCNAIIETSSNTLIKGCANTIIPNTVTTIGGAAFFNASYHHVRIPASVTSIESKAFAGCFISSVTCFATTPPAADERLFNNGSTYGDSPLYVPVASVSAYKNAVGWNFFYYVYGMGDVNGDNTLGIDDITSLIDVVLGGEELEEIARADANCDGDVNIVDVTDLIDMVLTNN